MPKGQEDDNEDMVIQDYDQNMEAAMMIPGLGLEEMSNELEQQQFAQQQMMNQQHVQRKVPFNKKIPKKFENEWSENKPSQNKHKKINSNNMRYHQNNEY